MPIVDAQVHIWSGGKPANLRHRQVPAFTKDELLKEMGEAGVDAAVIHPPTSWDPNANELAVEAARQHPDRFAILGNFPLDNPESRALLDGWKKRPGMLGLRFTFLQPHQQTWPTDGTIDWLWPPTAPGWRCATGRCVRLSGEEVRWRRGRDRGLVMGRAVCDWIGGKLQQ